MHLAPANVRGGPVVPAVSRGLAWWHDGILFVASGRPDDPRVDSYPIEDQPIRRGRVWRIGDVVATSCGCSSPWKRVDPAGLEDLATVHDGVAPETVEG